VPEDGAQLMFGIGKEDKSEALGRLGKSLIYDPKTKQFGEEPGAATWLANFTVSEAVLVEKQEGPPPKKSERGERYPLT